MKRFIVLLAVAAVLFLAVTSIPVAIAQSGNRIVIPDSSVVHPEDLGVRAHTNITLVVREVIQIGDNGAPVVENPLSLACIYHLVNKPRVVLTPARFFLLEEPRPSL